MMPGQPSTPIMFFIALLLVGFPSANLTTDYCWGSDNASTSSTITLDVNNEPLRSVLEKISKTTRWKINAPDKWMDKPVTQTLKKVTLEEGLRSVLNNAGIEDILLMYDENIKVVTLFDTEGPQKQAANRPPAQPNAKQQFFSTTGLPDPILERARREARPAPSRENRRTRRQASSEEE